MAYTITIHKVQDTRNNKLRTFLLHQLWLIRTKREKYQHTDSEILADLEQYFQQRADRIQQYHTDEKQRALKIRAFIQQLDQVETEAGEATDGV